MPPLTLEQALALPQAHYLTKDDLGIKPEDVVSADMYALIVANRTSKLPILHADNLSICMCIAIENTQTGAVFLGHMPELRKEALQKMLQMARRSPNDKLQVHLIGACPDLDGTNNTTLPWRDEMESMIKVLNNSPNTELRTFDVGTRPHPNNVAFARDATGTLRLVRGSRDFTNIYDMVKRLDDANPFKDALSSSSMQIKQPQPPENFYMEISPENPFYMAYDGRLEINQASSKQRAQQLKSSESGVVLQ